jgi:hypothetical protein
MSHSVSEAADRALPASAEQSAQLGAQIAFPTLSKARPALVPALAQVMDAAHREQLLNLSPALSPALLEQAVGSLFRDLQALLGEREGERLQGAWRRELWDAQGLGWLALPGNRSLAKRLQLQAAPGGRPLTVCFGRRSYPVSLPAPFDKQVYPEGDGCGLVGPDSVGLRRPSFRYYCPRCRRRQSELGRKALSAAVARLQERFPILLFDQAGRPLPGFWGRCSRCREEFVNTSAKVRRCERCRRGHR